MLSYQTHSQGSTATLSLCEPRDHAYALSLQHLIAKSAAHSPTSHHSIDPDVYSSWHTPRLRYEDSYLEQKSQMLGPASMNTSSASAADLPRLIEIEFAAFRHETVNHRLSYRDANDQTHIRRALRTYRKYMNNLRASSTEKAPARRGRVDSWASAQDLSLGFKFRKVTSPGSSQIVAFCKSEMVALTPEEFSAPLDEGYDGEPQMNRDWFALNEKLHRQYCGLEKHCYFGMLATHPDFQHQGAASKLMDELMAEADQLGVEVYCEATKTGRPLYEKYGFVAVKDIDFSTADYGADFGAEHQTVMVRGALGRDGKRGRVRSWSVALADTTKALLDAGIAAEHVLDMFP